MSASQSRRITARKIASGELSWTTDISRPPLTAADSSDALAPDDLMNHADSKSGSIKPMGTSIDLEQVLLEQLPSVRSIARGIHNRLPQQVPIDDLIQAGILGLIDAVHKFDPTNHVQLICYARFRIRGAILDSLREMDWGSRNLRRQARRIEETRQALNARLGRVPREEEIAAELNISLEAFQHVDAELCGLALRSLEQESFETQPRRNADKYLPISTDMDPFSVCFQREMKSFVMSVLDDSDKRECQVLTLYYLEELTMKEVGRELGIGESRVSQIHSKALVRLREKLGKILDRRNRIAAEKHCPGQAT